MSEKEIILASTYQHALYTIGVLSNALNLALLRSSSGLTQDDIEKREDFIQQGMHVFERSSAGDQNQIIGMRLMPLGSVVVDEDGKLTSNS